MSGHTWEHPGHVSGHTCREHPGTHVWAQAIPAPSAAVKANTCTVCVRSPSPPPSPHPHLELSAARGADASPRSEALLVARLQLLHGFPRTRLEVVVLVKPLLRVTVQLQGATTGKGMLLS
eukprot:352440-Chlamydomonas_euryale.AAC.3